MLNARLLRLDDKAHEHAHDYHQLVLSLSGSAEFEVDGSGGEVCRMRACLVPGHAEHEFAGKGDNRMLIIDLDDQDISDDDPRLLAQLFETPRYPALDADFHNLLNYAGAELARYGSDPLLARALGGVLLRALHLRVFGEAKRQPNGSLDIARLDAHIESNLARRITVAELAQVACLSPSHFHAQFKDSVGLTPASIPAQEPPGPCHPLASGKSVAVGAYRRGVWFFQPECIDHGHSPLPGADAQAPAQARRVRMAKSAPLGCVADKTPVFLHPFSEFA